MKSLEFKAYDILQKYSFTKEDADAFLDYIKTASKDEVATKRDIDEVNKRIEKLEMKVDALEENLILKIEAMAYKTQSVMAMWMVGALLGQTGLIFGLLKLFEKI